MPRIYYGWIMLSAVALMTFASSGSRFSFGVFVQPMSETFGWDRAQLALAASLNLLVGGLFRPVAGILADRAGSKLVALVGVALAASALILTSYVRELWQFYFAYGLLLAIGYACASPVTVTTLVSHWFVKRRSLAMSIGSTGTSLGELVTVPLAMLAVLYTGWDAAFRTIAGFMVLIVVPAVFLLIHNRPADRGLKPYGQDERLGASGHAASGPSLTLRQAARSGDFWRLSFGFFVCGFTMSFASTHFVPFAMDMGFEPMAAANALGLVGGFSIVGGLGAGYLADRFSRKNVLAAVYLIRGLAFGVLLEARDLPTLYLGSLLLGVSWTSTSPLTSAITADRCGLKNLGTIFGMMFTIMPIGSAVGAYLGGVVYERAHSYELSLTASAIAGLAAALVVHGVRGPQPEIQSSRSDLRAASELVGQTWQSPKKGTPSPA
ncbi:MAG TPA: MFS transporter [Chloroflexota bacterium]|nr:MFS transporter [Chloroflexota bacterium]